MMKRAFSTVACMKLPYPAVLKAAKEAGLSAIEIRLDDQNGIFGLKDDEIDKFLVDLKESGLVICDFAATLTLIDYDETVVANGKKCLALAAKVGAKGVRVFLGPFSRTFSGYGPHNHEGIVKMLRELCAYGEKVGAEVWVETHNAYATGKSLHALYNDVGCPTLKFIWDVMHPYEVDEKPEETAMYLRDILVHVHIKDGKRFDDPDMATFLYTKLGEGEVPVRDCLSELQKLGYDGYLSLEWEDAWRQELKGMYPDVSVLLSDYNAYLDEVGKGIL